MLFQDCAGLKGPPEMPTPVSRGPLLFPNAGTCQTREFEIVPCLPLVVLAA